MNVSGPYWWKVNIGSGNGLVPSGNKPLPEPVFTKISNAMWPQGHNELTSDGVLSDEPEEHTSVKLKLKYNNFHSISNCHLGMAAIFSCPQCIKVTLKGMEYTHSKTQQTQTVCATLRTYCVLSHCSLKKNIVACGRFKTHSPETNNLKFIYLIGNKSTLILLMAWCQIVHNLCLIQWWHKTMTKCITLSLLDNMLINFLKAHSKSGLLYDTFSRILVDIYFCLVNEIVTFWD